MNNKLAFSGAVLRALYEKRAGMLLPVALVGATMAGGAHVAKQGLEKAKEYNREFQPSSGESQMNLMDKIAEVAPDKYQFIVASSYEVLNSPFRDEILEELDSITKQASPISQRWADFLTHNPLAAKALLTMGAGAATVGGAAAMGIAYGLAGDMYDSVRRGLTKGRNYKNMLLADPSLRELPAADVQRAFSVLHRFNPEFASDPTVAASWVKRQAQFPEFDTKSLSELVSNRKTITESKRLPAVPQIPGQKGPKINPEREQLEMQRLRQDLDLNKQRFDRDTAKDQREADRDIRDQGLHPHRLTQIERQNELLRQQNDSYATDRNNKSIHDERQEELWRVQMQELRDRMSRPRDGNNNPWRRGSR